jgi:hypothetical protein
VHERTESQCKQKYRDIRKDFRRKSSNVSTGGSIGSNSNDAQDFQFVKEMETISKTEKILQNIATSSPNHIYPLIAQQQQQQLHTYSSLQPESSLTGNYFTSDRKGMDSSELRIQTTSLEFSTDGFRPSSQTVPLYSASSDSTTASSVTVCTHQNQLNSILLSLQQLKTALCNESDQRREFQNHILCLLHEIMACNGPRTPRRTMDHFPPTSKSHYSNNQQPT